MVDLEKRKAWIALNLAPGLSSSQVRRLCLAFEDPREVLRADAAQLQRQGGLGPKRAARLAAFPWVDARNADLARARYAGAMRILDALEAEYSGA